MDPLQKFVAFFEKHKKSTLTHAQYHIAKAILLTNEGKQFFLGEGRGIGKTTLLAALEAFAHENENELAGSVPTPRPELEPEKPKDEGKKE